MHFVGGTLVVSRAPTKLENVRVCKEQATNDRKADFSEFLAIVFAGSKRMSWDFTPASSELGGAELASGRIPPVAPARLPSRPG